MSKKALMVKSVQMLNFAVLVLLAVDATFDLTTTTLVPWYE